MNIKYFPAFGIFGLLVACNPDSEPSVSSVELGVAACSGIEQFDRRTTCYDEVSRSIGAEVFNPESAQAEFNEIILTLGLNRNYTDPEYPLREVMRMADSLGIEISHIRDVNSEIGLLNVLELAKQVRDQKSSLDFRELIQLAEARSMAADLGIRTNRSKSTQDIVGGQLGMPRDVERSENEHGAIVRNGEIIMIWKDDGSELAGTTYTLAISSINQPLQWIEGGTCKTKNLC